MSDVLKQQGACTHLWLDRQQETRCGSRVGQTTVHTGRVTCMACIRGHRAADTVTDAFGKRTDERGQGRLF